MHSRPDSAATIATILLVEDDLYVRDATAGMLRGADYHVIEAVDGRDACRVCESGRSNIDLLVTDVFMPRVSGPELVAQLRRVNRGLRVLYVSGQSVDALRRAGCDGSHTLQKPFSRDQLLEHVRAALASGAGVMDVAGL